MKHLVTPSSEPAPKFWRFEAKLPPLAVSAILLALSVLSAGPSQAQTDCATIASSTERLSCYDRAADVSQQADHQGGEVWGPEIVAAGDLGYSPCGAQRNDPTCLRGLGFSDQATAFAHGLDGDYGGMSRAVEFRELGAVDLGIAEVIGASVWGVPVLLNGSPDFIPVTPTLDLFASFKDETSQAMLARFPEASTRDSELRAHRILPDGTQRFVLLEAVTDQCRACDLIGSATTFLEIGPSTGGTLVRRPIGLLLRGAEGDKTLTAELIRSSPESLQVVLNALGYDAGPMDGYPGPQSRTALMEFQAEHCLPVTGQPDRQTADALIGANGFVRPCEGTQIPTGVYANTPLLPGVYVDDLAKCQLENLPYEDIHLSQRLVRPEGVLTFGQEGACTVRRSDIRDGVTLFRGQCAEGNESAEAKWVFDVTSNETYVELKSVFDVPPRSFAKCPDDSTLRQAWSAWFEGAQPASRNSDLPVVPGIYLNTSATGGDMDLCAVGMNADAALEVGKSTLNFYESRCEVLSAKPAAQSDELDLALRCIGEGQTWEAKMALRPISGRVFVLDQNRYELCPANGQVEAAVAVAQPSQRVAAAIPRWPFPKNGLRGAEIDLATAMALGVHFGSPAEVFADGAFPAGLDGATEFEKRRAVADMVDALKQRSQEFSGKDDLYLVFEVQGDARERSAIWPYDFERGTFRLCLPTTFFLPLNNLGIMGRFPTSILVGFPEALGDQANCSYGEVPGQSAHRSHAYYTIEMKDVAEAETFDKLVRQSLRLRVYCYLSARTLEEGKQGTYKREPKTFGPGWPLICTAARIEGSQTQDSDLIFALDFTSGKAVFEAKPSASAP